MTSGRAVVAAACTLILAAAGEFTPAYAVNTLLKVTKRILPADDPGRFNLSIDGVNHATNVGQGGSTGLVQVTPGTHIVRESAYNSSTNVLNYRQTFSGDCNALGHVTLAVSNRKTCTLLNTRKKWVIKAPMPTPREQIAVGVIGNSMYVAGGQSNTYYATLEAYNSMTNTWSTKAPMPTARTAAAAGVINGILYVVGGRAFNAGGGDSFLSTLEAHNPATNTWTTKAAMPTPRAQLSATVVGGKLYVMGGNSGNYNPALNAVEAYDPATNTWTTKAPMPVAQTRFAAAAVNNQIITVGGLPNGNLGAAMSLVQAYSPGTNSWASRPSLPSTRFDHASAFANGLLYVVGGFSSYATLTRSEAYIPTTNSWFVSVPMAVSQPFVGAGVINNKLYVVGGRNFFSGSELGTLEVYDP